MGGLGSQTGRWGRLSVSTGLTRARIADIPTTLPPNVQSSAALECEQSHSSSVRYPTCGNAELSKGGFHLSFAERCRRGCLTLGMGEGSPIRCRLD